jgi:hypothetical protein
MGMGLMRPEGQPSGRACLPAEKSVLKPPLVGSGVRHLWPGAVRIQMRFDGFTDVFRRFLPDFDEVLFCSCSVCRRAAVGFLGNLNLQ